MVTVIFKDLNQKVDLKKSLAKIIEFIKNNRKTVNIVSCSLATVAGIITIIASGITFGYTVKYSDEVIALVSSQDEYAKAAAQLQKQNAAYNDFCEKNNLKKLSDRLSVAKWTRSEAAKATAAARKLNKQ